MIIISFGNKYTHKAEKRNKLPLLAVKASKDPKTLES